jgi:hypothetical protein
MSLIFPNGSRTVTTLPWGSPFGAQTYGMPRPQSQRQNQPQQQVFGNSSMGPVQAGGPNTQQGQGSPSGGIDMSAYSPGRARPVPPLSQGTPFQAPQQKQGYNYNANEILPGNFGRPPDGMQYAGGTPYFDEGFASGRPPFTQSAVGVGGQAFSDPSQAFAQRDALIQRINEARAPVFANSGIHATPPPQQPPLDFNALLAQANNMVANGWQNPFAQQPAQVAPQPETTASIRGLLKPPAQQQPAFQEQPIPQVAGTVDYSSNGASRPSGEAQARPSGGLMPYGIPGDPRFMPRGPAAGPAAQGPRSSQPRDRGPAPPPDPDARYEEAAKYYPGKSKDEVIAMEAEVDKWVADWNDVQQKQRDHFAHVKQEPLPSWVYQGQLKETDEAKDWLRGMPIQSQVDWWNEAGRFLPQDDPKRVAFESGGAQDTRSDEEILRGKARIEVKKKHVTESDREASRALAGAMVRERLSPAQAPSRGAQFLLPTSTGEASAGPGNATAPRPTLGSRAQGPQGGGFAYGMPSQYQPSGRGGAYSQGAGQLGQGGGYPSGMTPSEYSELVRQQEQTGLRYPQNATFQERSQFNEMVRQQRHQDAMASRPQREPPRRIRR